MINWIDLIILIVFIAYVWDGYRRGFLRLTWELLGVLIAFVFALKFYIPATVFFKTNLPFLGLYTKPVSFLAIWFLAQLIFYIIGHYLSFYIPVLLKESKINYYLGMIPAALKGLISISVLLILVMILPISNNIKDTIQKSLLGNILVQETTKIESKFETIFTGDNIASGSLTSTPLDESSKLDFKTTNTTIDGQSEFQMISMVNMEREKVGLKPLKEDILLRNVARSHSRDMLIRGYFSHDSPTGETLADRLKKSQAIYTSAAENIAIAPTIELAHMGLMNSLKHKENILDPAFTRIGIGVIDAGQYGLMVTQNFTR